MISEPPSSVSTRISFLGGIVAGGGRRSSRSSAPARASCGSGSAGRRSGSARPAPSCPSGFSRACSRSFRASIPTGPLYIGASTWTSRIGSTSKLAGARSATTSTTVSSARSAPVRSMKKKSRSWSGPGSRWGSRPWLISWAAVVIIERAAWRKIWLSRTTGATPEAIRSSNGLPAPIGGSWSASPTRTTWVDSARPLSSTSISRRFSIEDSSTITRSTGSGRPGRNAASRPGNHSSRRWIVRASWPVASSIRRAARPVGAQSATSAFAASASATICRVQTVLPTPGPPVRTETRAAKAPRTAAHCSSVRLSRGSSPGSWSR